MQRDRSVEGKKENAGKKGREKKILITVRGGTSAPLPRRRKGGGSFFPFPHA